MKSKPIVTEQVCLTVEQINAIKLESRILGVHSIFNGKLIVVCRDGLLRLIKFNGKQIEWLDSYNEQK